MIDALQRLAILADLSANLPRGRELEPLLRAVVDQSARLLPDARVSIRLIGEDDTLLATCRAGEAMHGGSGAVFRRGEGLVGQVALTGEPLRTGDAESHPAFVARDLQLRPLGSFLGVAIWDENAVIGVLAAVHPDRDHFDEADEQALRVVAALCAERVAVARLDRMARLDALTRVLNRHGLRLTMRDGEAAGGSSSIVLLDIDHFKRVNDSHGHATGDAVLQAVAEALESTVRGGDSVARYGGEEFLLLLPGVGVRTALIVAERARAAVAKVRIAAPTGEVAVTISAGIAERAVGETSESAIARADAALYRAKHEGRDRVCVG